MVMQAEKVARINASKLINKKIMTNRTMTFIVILDFIGMFFILNGFFKYDYLVETILVAAATSMITLKVLLIERKLEKQQEKNIQ